MSPGDFLSRFVQTQSFSRQEDAAATLVFDTVADWGLEPKRDGNNVRFEIGTTGPRILMVSHLDTVALCEGWNVDPFAGEWTAGKLTGLGANDAKGCGTAMLFAARELASLDYGRVVVALTAEEENGGADGIARLLPQLGEFDGAFVGEPTSLNVCTAQRGMLLFRCEAEGVSAHVAHGHLGENAIHKAARDIVRLEAMRFEPDPVLGETRAQVSVIQGGKMRNVVPDRCEFFVDFRTTPNLDHTELATQLRETLETKIIVHSERYLPKSISHEHPLAKAALAASPSTEPVGSATVSDWAFLGDIPAVKVGPGDTKRSHTPNEYLLQAELEAGVRFYAEAARQFFRLA